jgi:hypothetical protein
MSGPAHRRVGGALLLAALLLLALAFAPRAGAAVYWSNTTDTSVVPVVPGTIGRANLDGTGVNQAFIGGAQARGVASDGAHLYWTNGANRSIGRANLDGTGVNQNFITGVDSNAVAVDAAHIYWDTRDGSIGRANLDGSGVNPSFIPQVGAVFGVAVDQAHVYWSTFNSIGQANLDGTGANQSFILFDPVSDLPCGVAVDAGHVYWANGLGTIGRANLDGTAANPNFVQVGQAGEDLTCGVAVDSAHLYWAHGALNPPDTGDGIGRANLDGTGANPTFITTPQPLGVAVDAAGQAVTPHPAVSTVSPNSGSTRGGTPITITGSGFVAGDRVVIGQGNGPGAGAIAATGVSLASSTRITATTGGGAQPGTWNLFVIAPDGTASQVVGGDQFTYTAPPAVSTVSPNSGSTRGGTPITITGSGFVAGDRVVIGQGSSTRITATTGGGAQPGTWNLFVIAPDGTASQVVGGDQFTYTV